MPERRIAPTHLAGAILGIALEVYDFTTFSYFAVAIAHTFFPTQSPFLGLMLSLGTVGAGFLSRPLGALLIGRYADRVGRTPAMTLSFALMGASILMLCVTPSYRQIGVTAPLLVLTARMIQGFALGGEVGSTTAFLLEAAPIAERGRYCALQTSGQGLAAVLAGIVGTAVASLLDNQALESYGWRLAMLVGAAVLPIGLVIRASIPETLNSHPYEPRLQPDPTHRGDKTVKRLFLIGLVIIAADASITQIFRYMTTYCIAFLHMRVNVSLAVQIVTGFFMMTFSILGGALSDIVGRRPVMIVSQVLCLAAIFPAFHLIVRYPSTTTLFGGMAVLALFNALNDGATIVAVSEALPQHLRATAFALIYAIALAAVGSSTQPLVTWLIHVTDNTLAVSWCAITALAVSLSAKWLLGETAPCRARKKEAPALDSSAHVS